MAAVLRPLLAPGVPAPHAADGRTAREASGLQVWFAQIHHRLASHAERHEPIKEDVRLHRDAFSTPPHGIERAGGEVRRLDRLLSIQPTEYVTMTNGTNGGQLELLILAVGTLTTAVQDLTAELTELRNGPGGGVANALAAPSAAPGAAQSARPQNVGGPGRPTPPAVARQAANAEPAATPGRPARQAPRGVPANPPQAGAPGAPAGRPARATPTPPGAAAQSATAPPAAARPGRPARAKPAQETPPVDPVFAALADGIRHLQATQGDEVAKEFLSQFGVGRAGEIPAAQRQEALDLVNEWNNPPEGTAAEVSGEDTGGDVI